MQQLKTKSKYRFLFHLGEKNNHVSISQIYWRDVKLKMMSYTQTLPHCVNALHFLYNAINWESLSPVTCRDMFRLNKLIFIQYIWFLCFVFS